ncbi:hypothetical protein [Streptomyces fagopyri]|uniref:hypothetical protein n=1 Tax=Streptomyces fagopyri TaxID=2662397 RepID=UPI003809B133
MNIRSLLIPSSAGASSYWLGLPLWVTIVYVIIGALSSLLFPSVRHIPAIIGSLTRRGEAQRRSQLAVELLKVIPQLPEADRVTVVLELAQTAVHSALPAPQPEPEAPEDSPP